GGRRSLPTGRPASRTRPSGAPRRGAAGHRRRGAGAAGDRRRARAATADRGARLRGPAADPAGRGARPAGGGRAPSGRHAVRPGRGGRTPPTGNPAMSVSNWNESNRCAPAAMVTPRDLDELVAIVRDSGFPSPLRALGELHSLNESIETTGTAVFMSRFSKIEEPDRVNRRVTVGAGVRMIDLKNALRAHGLQLPVVPEIGNATAGSVACCGTKDSSLGPTGRGQISSPGG